MVEKKHGEDEDEDEYEEEIEVEVLQLNPEYCSEHKPAFCRQVCRVLHADATYHFWKKENNHSFEEPRGE